MELAERRTDSLVTARVLVDNHHRDTPGFEDWDAAQTKNAIRDLTPELQEAFIFVLAASHYSGYPSEVGELLLGKISLPVEELAFRWFTLCSDDDDDRRWPHSVVRHLGAARARGLLNRIVREAPDDCDAYVVAARLLLKEKEAISSKDIEEFRRTWNSISPQRREALAISLQPNPYEYFGRREGIIIIHGASTRLELVVGNTSFPVHTMRRTRWIDLELPAVRDLLWSALAEAVTGFAEDAPKLGHEREQVGALIERLMAAFRARSRGRSAIPGSRSQMTLDRYMFRVKEENRWGPDFALIFLFQKTGSVPIARYVLFQAKLIEDGSLSVPIKQLNDLLRSSWHSSFYITWESGTAPRCLSAAFVDGAVRTRLRHKGRSLQSAAIKWSDVSLFSDPFADLLADRFLCGELGDPLPLAAGETASALAERLAEIVGPPRFGLITFTATVGIERQEGGESNLVLVSPEDAVLWAEE